MNSARDSGLVGVVTPRPSRRYRAATAWMLWAVVVVNAAIIVWLWLGGGGVTRLHGVGDALTSLGRITGLVGAYLALIQVLLLARLPPVERFVGFDRLTTWHRLNGKICLYLVLGHVVFITLGYAANDRIPVPREISALLSSYPGMIAATVGTALMVLVVVTSLMIVRRRLRYEAWYAVHVLAYAGIALAWFHQVPTGNELSANVAASSYWNGLYLATLVLLVGFRLVVPIVDACRFRLRVAEVIIETPTVVSLRITGRRLDRLGGQAGQFFLWRFLTRGGWWSAHPFSLSAVPDGHSLRITVKSVGDFTNRVGAIPIGTRVVAEGPFGVFTAAVRRRDKVLLVAGGIGITPIRALFEALPGDVALVYRVLQQNEIVFRDELAALARSRGVALYYVVGDHRGPDGRRLMTPEHLRSMIPDISDREIYICGPPGMTRYLEATIRAAGVPSQYIHTERFAL